jgi:hypothetical protein
LPAGSTLWVETDTPISAYQSAPGTTFVAHVPEEIRTQQGEVLVPQGAQVVGRVVEMLPARAGEPLAVRLEVNQLEMAGTTQPLAAEIVRADPPRRGVRATDVVIGAGAGALLGAILDGGRGALIGGAVGAGAGTLVSLGRQGEVNELPRGTRLALELQQPVRTLAAYQNGRYYY